MRAITRSLGYLAVVLVVSACDSGLTEPDVDPMFARTGGAHVVSDCMVITTPGTYVLRDDLLVDGREACTEVDDFDPNFFNLIGIRIEASNVRLNLAGNTIRGDESAACPDDPFTGDPLGPCGIGIRIADGVEHVHITAGTIDGGGLFFDGIQASGTGISIDAVTSTGNARFGMGSIFCGDCSFSGNTFSGNGNAGIQTVFAGGDLGPTKISGNRFIDNGVGITLGVFSADVRVLGNEISGSTGSAIVDFLAPQGGHTIQGNRISHSGGNGIFLFSNNNTVRGNQVSDSGVDGVAILEGGFFPGESPTTGNVVQGNRVTGSGGVDLRDDNATCGNTWKSNTFETDSEGDGPRTGCIQ